MSDVTPGEGYTSLQHELDHLCELLERVANRCAWDKHDHECTYTERLNREMYRKWLDRCSELEVALGL